MQFTTLDEIFNFESEDISFNCWEMWFDGKSILFCFREEFLDQIYVNLELQLDST